jgi:peroxiredoxin
MPRSARILVVGLLLVCLMPLLGIANQFPVARISAYRTSAGGAAVVFDGSTSTDPDGQVVRYQWTFGDGTTGSGSPVTHTYPQPSSFAVTLVVWDNGSETHLVTQIVDVASLPLQAQEPGGTTAVADVPIGSAVGQRAPEIALPSVSGGMVYLSAYLGRPVLVEFWLSTCPGCLASTPALEHYRSLYASQGLVVMLVILDRSTPAATSFLSEYGYRDFVLAWENSGSKPTRDAYGVVVTPTAFLVDRTGVIRYAGHPSGLNDPLIARWL